MRSKKTMRIRAVLSPVSYTHLDVYKRQREIHEFGSRTVHVIEIVLSDGRWKIRKDWYMDPLGDDVSEPAQPVSMSLNHGIHGRVGMEIWEDSFSMSPVTYRPITAAAQDYGILEALNSLKVSGRAAFDRDKALDYAVKHSGVRALPDGGRYNSKYRVYTFIGGDCANFASQVLHAGGIPQGQGWHYTKEGSTASVSYTHLDVYKRQESASQACYSAKRFNWQHIFQGRLTLACT